MSPTVVTLTQLPPGQVAHIDAADLSPHLGRGDADLLRAMGLRPNASVRMCRVGDPCIVQVGRTRGDSCRLGLARRIADRISVCIAPEVQAPAATRA